MTLRETKGKTMLMKKVKIIQNRTIAIIKPPLPDRAATLEDSNIRLKASIRLLTASTSMTLIVMPCGSLDSVPLP